MGDQETINIIREIRESVLAKYRKGDSKPSSLYERAGITDIKEFYRTRYVSGGILHPQYFDAVNRFDIRWARTMWVFHNVRPGSIVLDLGCGAGLLSLLKRKHIRVLGIDISSECCDEAVRNGYDDALVAKLIALPFPDGIFDYVVSLDVMGHVEAQDKDAVIGEMKRVLKAGGETLHGIECLDRSKRKSYEQMTAKELRDYISVDGHVGMEDKGEIEARFARLFSYVDVRPRFSICQPAEEFIKQADEYGLPICEPEFLRYVKSLNSSERRAFDMAMGYVFSKISEYDLPVPTSEYVLVKASDVEFKAFYDAHRSQVPFLPVVLQSRHRNTVPLDRYPNASFGAGWYQPENFPPVARWMGQSSSLTFKAEDFNGLRLDLTTHIPDLHRNPLQIDFILNGTRIHSVTLVDTGWLELRLDATTATEQQHTDLTHSLDINASRTWIPNLYDRTNEDGREMSIAVCNLELTF